ncbi:MAG: hypothetical protein AAFQ79_04975 [Pseudomonadota bacterium]
MLPPELVLYCWPFVAFVVFFRVRPAIALPAAIIAGYLFLPPRVVIDFPLIPELDKNSVSAITGAILGLYFVLVRRMSATAPSDGAGGPRATEDMLPNWVPRHPMAFFLLAMLAIAPIITVLTNGDTIRVGAATLPGLRLYDAGSMGLEVLVALIPFFLARRFLYSAEHHRLLLIVLAVAGAIYAIPALYEVRMSPQLNRIVYGFFQHSWIQHIRGEGFRPLVFLQHGIWLGIFLCMALLAAFTCVRSMTSSWRYLMLPIGVYILATLVLAKSLGALLIAMVLIPVVLLSPKRVQLLTAAGIAVLAIGYPYMRSIDIAPVDQVVELAERIDADRAQSFQFRLDNEDILLAKARERMLAGWGGWGRGRVVDDDGNDISVTDGYWIITFGQGGIMRYVGEFGLLTMAIFVLALRPSRHRTTIATTGVALALSANLVDLLPNASISPVTWLLAGALLGRIEAWKYEETSPATAVPDLDDTTLRRRRQKGTAAPAPVPAGSPPVIAGDGDVVVAMPSAQPRNRHSRFATKHVRQKI